MCSTRKPDPEHVATFAPHRRLDDMAVEIEPHRDGIAMRQTQTLLRMNRPDSRDMNQKRRDGGMQSIGFHAEQIG